MKMKTKTRPPTPPAGRPTRAEADALFRDYARTRSVALRNRIAEQFVWLVHETAARMASRLASYVDPEELALFGMPGLIWAVERYDPDSPAAFTTFAVRRIYGAVYDEIRHLDHVPRLTRNRSKLVRTAAERFYVEHGRDPTPAELQAALGLDDHDFALVAGDRPASLSSLSDPVATGDGVNRPAEVGDTVAARHEVEPGTMPDARAILRDVALPKYGLRAGLLLRLRYVDNLTMREIGEALRISESRVSQYHGTLIESLRGHFRIEEREAA